MPHTVRRRIKKIIITNNTQFILNAYQEAIRGLSEEQKNVLGLSTEEKSRKVSPSVYVRQVVEFVTKDKHGATECYLGAIECSLNDFANQLKERYLSCINRLVEAEGKTAEDTEKEVIDSRYILLRELLLRLVIVALSDEENRKRSGKPLIAALACFVQKIAANKDNLLGLNTGFRFDLNKELANWVSDFSAVVDTIELIHAPENALRGLVDYLSRIKKAIKTYVLVSFHSIKSDEISDDWIDKTYQEFLLGKNRQRVSEAEGTLTIPSVTSFTDAQLKKMASIFSGGKKDYITNLFSLLNHTELLYRAVTCLDSAIQASNWVLLLSGKLSFDALIEHLTMHRDLCNHRLAFEKTGLDKTSSASENLLKHGYSSVKQLTGVVDGLCKQLRQLANHYYQGLVIEQFRPTLTNLLTYQEELNIQLICDIPTHQSRIQANRQQSIEYPVAPTLSLHASSQRNRDMIVADREASSAGKINPIIFPREIPSTYPSTMERLAMRQKITDPLLPLDEDIVEMEVTLNTQRSPNTSIQSTESNQPMGSLDEYKRNTPGYIKAFFNGFSDKKYEEIVLMLWECSQFKQQMQMGGKNKPKDIDKISPVGEKDFLYQFHQNRHLPTAGPLCKEVTKIIHAFESQQMDYEKPSNFFLVSLNRDTLWEERHYELFYLKYWCVAHSAGDESNLLQFIRRISLRAETRILSAYNSFVDELKVLVSEIDLGKGNVIPRQYAFPQGETARINALYEKEKAENLEKTQIIEQKDQKNSRQESIINALLVQVKEKNDLIDKQNQQIKEKNDQINEKNDQINEKNRELERKNGEIQGKNKEIKFIHQSYEKKIESLDRNMAQIMAEFMEFKRNSQHNNQQSGSDQGSSNSSNTQKPFFKKH
jgi:hypothetical protein